MPRKWSAGLAVLAIFMLQLTQLEALQLRSYSAAEHDRFTGFPSFPVPNTTFIHENIDLTGVGWVVGGSQPRSLTLVSPRFFVGARHFRPSTGSSIRFVAEDGTIRNYTIKEYHDILNDDSAEQGGPKPTDLSLGELVETVTTDDGVNFQPYLNLPTEAAYLAAPNNQLIVLGKTIRGGNGITNAISDFFGTPVTSGGGINNTRTLEFVYQNLGGLNNDAFAETGDSGSPSLVNVDGRGAIVGIHTAVLAAVGTTTTIDSFVPHPAYISQINLIMEADGYHMTEANTASISLTAASTVPQIIRAGYPTSIQFDISNPDLTNNANNLKVAYTLPAESTNISSSGPLWVVETNERSISARKGGLAASEATSLSTSVTFPEPGKVNLSMEYFADESAVSVQMIPINVIESYLSWSSALSNPAPSADIDLDGFSNLVEYAFGGDPEFPSMFQSDGVTQLAASFTSTENANEYVIQYLRRNDAQQRALTYTVERSSSLGSTSWTDISSEIIETTTDSVNSSFDLVTVTLGKSGDKMFYRVSIALSESL